MKTALLSTTIIADQDVELLAVVSQASVIYRQKRDKDSMKLSNLLVIAGGLLAAAALFLPFFANGPFGSGTSLLQDIKAGASRKKYPSCSSRWQPSCCSLVNYSLRKWGEWPLRGV